MRFRLSSKRRNGSSDLKTASSTLALLTGLLMLAGIVGCQSIARWTRFEFHPGFRALAQDLKNISATREVYFFDGNTFLILDNPPYQSGSPVDLNADEIPDLPADLPAEWDIRQAIYADITGDGDSEYILHVWRPWHDWRHMAGVGIKSPLADFKDEKGDSCHIILINPEPSEIDAGLDEKSYQEIWAGSALPIPVVRIAVGDVDGDAKNELVVIEGDYKTGRDGPGERVSVWEWDQFGFKLAWRGEDIQVTELSLEDINGDNIPEIIVSDV